MTYNSRNNSIRKLFRHVEEKVEKTALIKTCAMRNGDGAFLRLNFILCTSDFFLYLLFKSGYQTHKQRNNIFQEGAAQKVTWLVWPIPVRGCCLATSQTFTAVPAVLTRMPSTVGWNCSTSTRVSSGPNTSPGPEGSAWPEAGSLHSFICGKE